MSLPPPTDNYIGEPQYPSPWTTKKPREGLRDTDAARIVSLAPDVCKTPIGSSTPPIPYPVVDFCGHDESYATSVFFTSQKAMVFRSNTTHVHGDAPGTACGVKSGTVGKRCHPIEHAVWVRAEGSQVIRHLDRFFMNDRNTHGEAIFVRDTQTYEAPENDDPVPGSLLMGGGSVAFGAPTPLPRSLSAASNVGTMPNPGGGTLSDTAGGTKGKISGLGRRGLWAEVVDALTLGLLTQRQIENMLAEVDYYATTPNLGLDSDQMAVLAGAGAKIRSTALPTRDYDLAQAIKDDAWAEVRAMSAVAAARPPGYEKNVRITQALITALAGCLATACPPPLGGYRGGADACMTWPPNDQRDSHHMPAKKYSPLPPAMGPSIQMDRADHQLTNSFGGRVDGPGYATQRALLARGQVIAAMEMDIASVKSLFPGKYDTAIEQMRAYANCLRQLGLIR